MSRLSPHAYENALVASMMAKRRTRGECVDCGKETRYGGKGGRRTSPRCRSCAGEQRRKWTQERVIAAIQRFAKEYGRTPTSADWRTTKNGKPDYAPCTDTVRYVFGTWAAAIVAAGFPQPRPGKYHRTDKIRRNYSEAQRRRQRDGVAR